MKLTLGSLMTKPKTEALPKGMKTLAATLRLKRPILSKVRVGGGY